jgi:tetratricopeptide (TPR) repeat protein
MTESRLIDELEHNPTTGKCITCNNPEIEEGYATHLCHECRKKFIRYPIPLWIKIFAGSVFIVILFALYTFPENLSVAVHLERGKDAERQNKFLTVKQEFSQLLKRQPNNVEAKAYLMLASFYNEDYESFFKYSEELDGIDIGNKELLARLNDAIDQFPHYYPDPDLAELIESTDSATVSLPDTLLAAFLVQHPENVFGLYTYASQLYDVENYKACDSVLEKLFQTDIVYQPALRLMANSKRQSGDYEASLEYCRRIIEINRESAYVYAIIARTYLKQKKDKEALEMVQKSMSLNDSLPYNIATLALAYHFNKERVKRDLLINEMKKKSDASSAVYYDYVIDVINQKQAFRN